MSQSNRAPLPADTALARRLSRAVEFFRASRTVDAVDLTIGVAVLGFLAGLLLGPIKGVVLGLPIAAAAMARNLGPDLKTKAAPTRMGRVVEMMEDALFFGIGAMIVFVPPFLAGWAAHRAVFAAVWGE